jgi:hypothetical protein
MGFFKDLLTNRRGYAFLIPVVTMGLQRAGIVANDDQVGSAIDQAAGLASALLALWSLRAPKA